MKIIENQQGHRSVLLILYTDHILKYYFYLQHEIWKISNIGGT